MQAPRVNGIDFVCYTENAGLRAPGWKIVVTEPSRQDPRRSARLFKILPHRYFPEYEYSIWMDGTHCPRKNPSELLSFCGPAGIAVFRHPDRSCIYEEARACIQRGFDAKTIRAQMARYRVDGYPEGNGLAQSTVIARRHNLPTVSAAMEQWWREVDQGSVRDQLSFDYVMWKSRMRYGCIPGHPYWNEMFYYTPHGAQPLRFRSILESKRASANLIWKAILRMKDLFGHGRDAIR